jgi:outer membrane protein assembly factor BamB
MKRRSFIQVTAATAVLSTVSTVSAVEKNGGTGRWPESGYDRANTGFAADNTGPVRNVSASWRYNADDDVYSAPVTDGDVVYFGDESGTLHAVQLSDGSRVWSVDAGSTLWSPLLHDGTVYAPEGGPDGETLSAFSAADGSRRWKVTFSGQPIGLTFARGTLFGEAGGTAFALDPDGSTKWETRIGSSPRSPVVLGDCVYYGSDERVFALSRETGTEEWSRSVERSVLGALAASDDTIFACTGTEEGTLYALSTDGTVRWTFDAPEPLYSSPAIVGDTVFVGTNGNEFFAVREGEALWGRRLVGGVVSAPAVVSDTVYFGTTAGYAYGLSVSDGTVRWRVETDGPVTSSPAVVDGKVLFGDGSGTFYAIGGETATGDTEPPTTTENGSGVESPSPESRPASESTSPVPGFGALSVAAALGITVETYRNSREDED